MWCRTAATSGPPTSGIMTRSRAAHRAPGTTTVPAEMWRRAAPCMPPGATPTRSANLRPEVIRTWRRPAHRIDGRSIFLAGKRHLPHQKILGYLAPGHAGRRQLAQDNWLDVVISGVARLVRENVEQLPLGLWCRHRVQLLAQ